MVFVFFVLATWCWVDVWPRGRLDSNYPQEHRSDFTVYTAAGKAAIASKSPYSVSNARGWTYLYMPLFCLLVAPLSFFPEGLQCVVWFWISIACLIGAFQEFNRLNLWAFADSRSQGRFQQWGGLFCVFGFSLASLNCLQRGQVGLLQFYLTLLGARILLTRPSRTSACVGGGVLASAIVLKLTPALPSAVLLFGLFLSSFTTVRSQIVQRFDRPLFMLLGLAIGLFACVWIVPSAIVGWDKNQSYLTEWRRDVLSRSNQLSNDPFAGNSHSIRNQSPMNGFWLMGNAIVRSQSSFAMDEPLGQIVLKWIRWGAAIMTLIAVIAVLSRGQENDLLIAFVIANAATLLVIPIARGHYFMAMWPATVWVPRWVMLSNPMQSQLASRLIRYIPPLLLILHYLFEHQLGALGLLGVGSWLWLTLLTATVVASRKMAFDR